MQTVLGLLLIFLLSCAVATEQNVFQYIGQPSGQFVHLVMLGGYRMYNPQAGQFLKQDSYSPFQGRFTMNHFNYAEGNPVILADTSGHLPTAAHKAIGFFTQCFGRNTKACSPPQPNEPTKSWEAEYHTLNARYRQLKFKYTKLRMNHFQSQEELDDLRNRHQQLLTEHANLARKYERLANRKEVQFENTVQDILQEIDDQIASLSSVLQQHAVLPISSAI